MSTENATGLLPQGVQEPGYPSCLCSLAFGLGSWREGRATLRVSRPTLLREPVSLADGQNSTLSDSFLWMRFKHGFYIVRYALKVFHVKMHILFSSQYIQIYHM